ncbi:MAG TPA: lyase family protein [Gemmatimonadales bacterium]|nr:lyase family protein [Gemmatimonadales bacterium]
MKSRRVSGSAGRRGRTPATLWSPSGGIDALMFAYTVGDDREWDSALLAWDIYGSLGHLEGMRDAGLVSRRDYAALRRGLRSALVAARRGRLAIGAEHEDAHSAVEAWLTRRLGEAGERIHTGRSRNDQVATDLRLFLKDRLLAIHRSGQAAAEALIRFAGRHRTALWPGYTHTRRAMPSSAALWAAAHAEGIVDTLEGLPALWRRVDRCPLGSAAGYGAPLPIRREVAARALGFRAVEPNVAAVQNGRGKLEAAALFWCTQLGHDLAKLSADVILYTGEEFGLLRLPASLATGSSIMPHKRNPDLFELTRARAAALEGDLFATMAIGGRLPSGYHRDFQLLKEPLIRGLRRTEEMLVMTAHAAGGLEVDRARGAALLEGGALATDEVMRRVESGTPFRRAYREVAATLKHGESFPAPAPREIVARRRATGGVGNVGLQALRTRIGAAARWARAEERRFRGALTRLDGSGA